MSAEQLPNQSPEQKPPKQEMTAEELEHYLKAESAVERGSERGTIESGEKQAEKAKIEALKEAVSIEAGSAEKKTGKEAGAPRHRHGVVSKKERTASYKKHMKQVQSELPPVQRAFSKVIHNPVVEKTSEVVGNTIARPNAILAGAVTSFILVLGVYLIAKHYGYMLSGFETIGAFIVGWIIGILYDFFKVMITGKK